MYVGANFSSVLEILLEKTGHSQLSPFQMSLPSHAWKNDGNVQAFYVALADTLE
jgi:hypothetical protein